MGCFFSKRINGNFMDSLKSPEKAAACFLPKYLGNGLEGAYLVCGGDFKQCPVKDMYVSMGLQNYWDSEERISHQNMREQAKIENGIK